MQTITANCEISYKLEYSRMDQIKFVTVFHGFYLVQPFTLSHMVLVERKQLSDFPILNKNTLFKWLKNLGFCHGGAMQKCKSINTLVLILCLHPATLLKTRLRHRWFLCEFCEFLQSVSLLRARLFNKFSCEF